MRRALYALALLGVGALLTALLVLNASVLFRSWYAEAAVAVMWYTFIADTLLWTGLALLFLVSFGRLRVVGWVGFVAPTMAGLGLLAWMSVPGGSVAAGLLAPPLYGVAVWLGIRASRATDHPASTR